MYWAFELQYIYSTLLFYAEIYLKSHYVDCGCTYSNSNMY